MKDAIKKVISFFKNVRRGIENLIYYFPVIWKDRNWDHSYHEYLMLAKLKKHYKYYTSGKVIGAYEGMNKDIKAMRICIKILERREIGWYTSCWYSKYSYKEESIFGESKLTEEEQTDNYRLLKISHEVEARDWNIFCDIYKKYFNFWWD